MTTNHDRLTFASTITAEGRRIKGSVQLAGTRTFRNGEYVQVDPAALIKASTKGIFASWEHDDGKLLAADSNGTLTVTRHEQGFDYETSELPDTTYANDALELVRGGYVTGSSFEIAGLRSVFTTDPDGTRVRTYTGIQHFRSVSPVRDPAFPSMSAAFAKENPVSDPIDESEAPAPAPAPDAPKFTAKTEDGESFASQAKRMELAELESWLDSLAAGVLTPARQAMYSAFAAEYDSRKAIDAEAQERAERMELAHRQRRGLGPKSPANFDALASDDYRHEFVKYLRSGDPRGLEQFAQSIAGDGTQGGYAVPDGFLNRIVETKAAYGGIQQIAEVITTADGQSLRWPSNNDTANSAAIATEGSAVASGGADLVFGTVALDAYTYDATGTGNVPLLVSKELIQDSAFDIEAYVARKLGQRLGRKMAADYATADGSGKPKGLFADSADTMTATTAYAAFAEHMFQVDQEYRDSGNCRWVFGDTTLAKVVASVDLNGRPLFIPSGEASGAGRPAGFILGYPVTLDQGSGTKVAFGDIRQAFIIRNVRGITIDVDPYTNIKSRQLAFHAWARTDSDIQDSAAVSISDYTSVTADAAAS